MTGEQMTPDLSRLRGLAEAATPGPWHRGAGENGDPQDPMKVWPDERGVGGLIARTGYQAPWDGWFQQPAADAAFIAAANPEVVISLINQVEALRAALAPFAACADELDGNEDVPRAPDGEWAKFRLLTDDYRLARQALSTPSPDRTGRD